MERALINSPLGVIEIIGNKIGIVSISLNTCEEISKEIPNLLLDCVCQLESYFRGELKEFNLSYDLQGSPFQKKVWHALQTIPYGKTLSYQDIAIQIGNTKAVQAVGTAIGKNPCPIIIACHRVINKNGKIGGFASGIENKKYLLQHEGLLLNA